MKIVHYKLLLTSLITCIIMKNNFLIVKKIDFLKIIPCWLDAHPIQMNIYLSVSSKSKYAYFPLKKAG